MATAQVGGNQKPLSVVAGFLQELQISLVSGEEKGLVSLFAHALDYGILGNLAGV